MTANRNSPATAERAAGEAIERRVQQLLAPLVERLERLEREFAALKQSSSR